MAAAAAADTEGQGSAMRSSTGMSTVYMRRPSARQRVPSAQANPPTPSSRTLASSAFSPSTCRAHAALRWEAKNALSLAAAVKKLCLHGMSRQHALTALPFYVVPSIHKGHGQCCN